MSSGSIVFPLSGVQSWKAPVANAAALPLTGNTAGDARVTNDNQVVNVWSGSAWISPSGTGTVTSVDMTVPAFLSVSGNPVTGSGTLAVSLSGTALPVANGGTGLTSGTSGGVLAYTASGTLASSGALTASRIVLGGGAGVAPTVLGSLGTTTTLLHGNAAGAPTFGAVSLTADVTGTLPIANGGIGITSGTSGGVLGFTASGTLASSVLLTANALVLGAGAGATPTPMGSLGTSTTVLHGNAAGAPTFAAVSLTADVSGALPIANGGTAATTKAAGFDALSPMTTSGDVIYGGASGTGTRLAKGSDGQVLTLASGLPSWAAAGGSITYGTDIHWVSAFNGFGSTATKIGKWSTVTQAVTTNGDITYASSATNGDSWTINHAGVYSIFVCLEPTAATTAQIGVSRNASSLTTNFISLALTEQLMISSTTATNEIGVGASWVLAVNDIIRVHTNGATMATGGTTGRQQFWIRRMV